MAASDFNDFDDFNVDQGEDDEWDDAPELSDLQMHHVSGQGPSSQPSPGSNGPGAATVASSPSVNKAKKEVSASSKKPKKKMTPLEKLIQANNAAVARANRAHAGLLHRVELLSLLAHVLQLNAMANDIELQSRILSVMSPSLQSARAIALGYRGQALDDERGQVAVASPAKRKPPADFYSADRFADMLLKWLLARVSLEPVLPGSSGYPSFTQCRPNDAVPQQDLLEGLYRVVSASCHVDPRQSNGTFDLEFKDSGLVVSMDQLTVLFVAAARASGYAARVVRAFFGFSARRKRNANSNESPKSAGKKQKQRGSSSAGLSAAGSPATSLPSQNDVVHVSDSDDETDDIPTVIDSGDESGKLSSRRSESDSGRQQAKKRRLGSASKVKISSKYFPVSGDQSESRVTPAAAAAAIALAAATAMAKSNGQGTTKLVSDTASKHATGPRAGISVNDINIWSELWCPVERRWIAVDVARGRVVTNKFTLLTDEPPKSPRTLEPPSPPSKDHSVGDHLESSHRILPYVVAVEPGVPPVDVSLRYAADWQETSANRALKCSALDKMDSDAEKWWQDSLQKAGVFCVQDDVLVDEDDQLLARIRRTSEERELRTLEQTQPMPRTVAGFKNHSVYALERHLTKYQAIYPRVKMGQFRKEDVFSRSAVCLLKSQDKWLEEGRTIQAGMQPIKRVKSRAKPGQAKQRAREQERLGAAAVEAAEEEQLTVGLFGEWQTEEYVAPAPVDGKIPRNGYGNIYMYKSSMLPPGCTHVRVPRAKAVANKLGIDAAPAMVGWDRHGRSSFPLIDGVVVLEENAEMLVEHCLAANAELAEKEQKKRRLTVQKNWKKLTSHLLTRLKVEQKYKQVSSTQNDNKQGE